MYKKKLIVANWKMNPQTLSEARRILMILEHRAPLMNKSEAVICPPALYLPAFSHYVHSVKLGAQNMHWEEAGAFTGESSPTMLKPFNVNFAILGHSERRLGLGETDQMVNVKVRSALRHKIIPIVCLGAVAKAKKTDMKKIVAKQFRATMKGIEKNELHKIVFVYEPTWAISTSLHSKPADGEHARELIMYIHKFAGPNCRVLYGGTVNKHNAREYAQYSEIDGALVGAASLDPNNFWEIIKEFERESIHRG